MLDLRKNTSCVDSNIGSHTHLCVNNVRQVIEVSNTPNISGPRYKCYKIGYYWKGVLEWVSGVKGIQYGLGKFPKVALNDDGYVVEVDEGESGFIFSRVGKIHRSNVIMWTVALTTGITGSQPCIAICQRTVVITFIRNGNANYCVGTLHAEDKKIQWSNEEHRFITGGVTDLCVALKSPNQVAVVYARSTLTTTVTPLYFITGILNHAEQRIFFSIKKESSQSFAAAGTCPSIGLKGNSVLVVYTQKRSVTPKKIKYSIGQLYKTSETHSYDVRWAVGKDTFDFTGERVAMAVNDKGVVIISHAQNRNYTCHIGKLYHETVI